MKKRVWGLRTKWGILVYTRILYIAGYGTCETGCTEVKNFSQKLYGCRLLLFPLLMCMNFTFGLCILTWWLEKLTIAEEPLSAPYTKDKGRACGWESSTSVVLSLTCSRSVFSPCNRDDISFASAYSLSSCLNFLALDSLVVKASRDLASQAWSSIFL